MPDAVVEVCVEGQSQCPFVTVSDRAGGFSAFGLPAGRYTVRAFPPSRSRLSVGLVTGVEVAAGAPVPSVEVVLPGSGPAPVGTVMEPARPSEDGGFSIRPGVPLDFRVPGCAEAAATLEVRSGSTVVRTVNLAEGPAGVYGAPLAAFPAGPPLRFVVTLDCPDGVPDGQASFFVYIDPSGTVTDTAGDPVPAAIVTLLRADTSIGPFEPVEDGSAVMSPGNRANPDSTDDQGRFAWDVISGFYRVRAEAAGMQSAGRRGSGVRRVGCAGHPTPCPRYRLGPRLHPPVDRQPGRPHDRGRRHGGAVRLHGPLHPP